MAQVHLTSGSNKKWIVIAGAVVALSAAAYWFTRSEDVTEAARVTDVTGAPSAVSNASVPESAFSNAAPTVEEGMAAVEDQKAAAKVIDQQPDLKPIKGPITERPAFVSPMEWAMLQGVVQQHANPDKEMTRMVNFLRFMKQMEALEATPKTADNVAKRHVLTAQLVEDLPSRVQGGDLELKDAHARLAEWLPEAVPDAKLRQQKSDAISKRLEEAGEAYKAEEAAKAK